MTAVTMVKSKNAKQGSESRELVKILFSLPLLCEVENLHTFLIGEITHFTQNTNENS